MSRRREPDRASLPPAALKQAELGQSKADWDREKDGPPAADFSMGPDGTAKRDDTLPGDRDPANEAHWGWHFAEMEVSSA
jgi:hypothetical protein